MLVSAILAAAMLAALLYGHAPFWLLAGISLALPLGMYILRRRGRRHLYEIDALAQRSRLGGWNVGLKVCACLLLLVFCLWANSLPLALAAALCLSAVTLATSPLRLSGYLSLLCVPASFIILGGLAILFDLSKTPLGFLDIPLFSFYLSASAATQQAAALASAKAFGALCCLYALSLSTPVYEITSFLRRAHLPAIFVELMALIYRYIFILLEEIHNMTLAAQARQGYRNTKNGFRSLSGIATGLLVRSFLRARRSFDAMEARCYTGNLLFLEPQKTLKAPHLAAVAAIFAILAGVLLLERGPLL